MTVMFDAIALAAGVAATPDHRSSHPAAHRVPAKARRAGPVRRLVRSILADIGGAVPLHAPLHAPLQAFEGLRRWRRRSKAIAELGALNNHLLRDIGVSRGSIREVVDAMLQAETGVRT